jgi:hypothetical protein
MTIYGREVNLIYSCLEAIIEQITILPTFLVETGKEEVK